MENFTFEEIAYLTQVFMIGASTGILLAFTCWCVRLIIQSFKKFF